MMPAIVTVSLSVGSMAPTAKRVQVGRLVAVEDLGNIENLFTGMGRTRSGRAPFPATTSGS